MKQTVTDFSARFILSMQQIWPLIAVLMLYAGAIVFINPLREYALVDDWSYARTVKLLYESGTYQPFPTIVASFQFQAGVGALFVHWFGFSFSSLHLSTLFIVMLGLIGFFSLCLVHDFTTKESAILTLTLLSCQQILLYSFSFMSDVTFLSALSITMALYSAGLKKNNRWFMLAGGFAATAMILIRPTGAALLGVLVILALWNRERRGWISFYAAGLILPAITLVLLIVVSRIYPPTWASQWVIGETSKYLSDPAVFIPDFLWRLMVIAEFLAWFALPVAVLVTMDFIYYWDHADGRKLPARDKMMVAILVVFMLCASVYGMLVMQRLSIMPILPLFPDELLKWPLWLLIVFTLFTIVSGSIMAWRLSIRLIVPQVWKSLPDYAHLMDVSAVLMAGSVVVYYHLADRYLFGIMPFAIIGTASMMRDAVRRWHWLFLAITLMTFLGATFWVRGVVERYDTNWAAADALYRQGIPEDHIAGPWEWNSYRGAFEQYLNDAGANASLTDYASTWLPERRKTADYVITSNLSLAKQPGWSVISVDSYEDMFLQPVSVYTLQRQSGSASETP